MHYISPSDEISDADSWMHERSSKVKPRTARRLPRDKIYIIKDVMMRLLGNGEMNKSMLLSLCGLNSKVHAFVLDDLEHRNFVTRKMTMNGAKQISLYNITEDGMQFCSSVLSPYEEVFPRKTDRKTAYELCT